MSSQILDAATRAELARRGWAIEAMTEGFVLRKAESGYAAKVHVVTLRRTASATVEVQGELLLHGASCAQTLPVCMAPDRLPEQLWPLMDATESLNVFSDDDDLF